MSVANPVFKGRTGEPYYGAGALRASSSCGAIWKDAPRRALDQGKMIVVAPKLGNVKQYSATFGAVGSNNAVGVIDFDTCLAYKASVFIGGSAENVDSVGGRLVVGTDAADNDLVTIGFWGPYDTAVSYNLPFKFVAGSTVRCGIRAKISDATQSEFMFGLAAVNIDPIGNGPDRCVIQKTDADLTPDLHLNQAGDTAAQLLDHNGAVVVVEDDTYFEAGFVVTGRSLVTAYWNGAPTFQSTLTNLPTGYVAPVIEIKNGEAVAKTLTVERFVCSQTMV